MVGWHHRLNGHESARTPGDSEGQACLESGSPQGREELDTTEHLNKNNAHEGLPSAPPHPGGQGIPHLPPTGPGLRWPWLRWPWLLAAKAAREVTSSSALGGVWPCWPHPGPK